MTGQRPGGHIYVIAFSNGVVKVGCTRNPAKRLSDHRSQARRFGATVTDEWQSPQHAEWEENEDELIGIAYDLGGEPRAAEYFTGIAFADVVAQARDLPFGAPSAATDEWRRRRRYVKCAFPAVPARMRITPTKSADIESMDAEQLDHARNMLLARTQNAIEGATAAAEHERQVFMAFYTKVRPLLKGDLTVSDVLEQLAKAA